MAYRVAIVGAGKIGALLDHPESPHIVTHAHGYAASGGFEIVGFVDRDLTKAQVAADRWGGRAFDRIEHLLESQIVDLISVCVPDEAHYQALLALASSPLKLIFLEKPAVRTQVEAETIRSIYGQLPVRVLVNYSRRFVPEIRKTREAIKRRDYGAFVSGVGYYGKGLLHNGSHLVDLLHFFLGKIENVEKISEVPDFSEDDPSVTALVTFSGGGTFFLRHIDCRSFEIFELDLTFERRRIRIYDLGRTVEEYSVKDDAVFDGYRTLQKESEYPTRQSEAMTCAVANIRGNLDRDEPLACTLEESLATVEACRCISRGKMQ